jgi:DNA segregation ATPase FtsK/SpoIIIE-like protein
MSEAKQVPLTDTSGRSHPLYAEACKVVREHKKGSISLVQRHLRIGWNTAAMLLEAMVGDVIAEMPPTTKMLAKARESA